MKIQQMSANDAITQAVVAKMLANSSVLPFAEFFPIVGNADYVRKAASASGGAFRAVNSDYAANQITPAFDTPTLKILGGKVEVDKAHERRGADIPSVRAAELLSFGENLGKQFQNFFFNGDDTTPEQFDGLKLTVPAGQKNTAATNGYSVPLGNSDANKTAQQGFLEKLNALFAKVTMGPQIIVMDGITLTRLTSIAREYIKYEINQFGNQIAYYNGIPVLDAGFDKDGNRVIPHTETCGTANNCTSIYSIRFGERSNLSIASNVGVEVKDLGVVGVHYTHNVDFDLDLSLLNDKAVARLEGLIIP